MGSNAIRFVAAEFNSEREYEVLASDRRAVRLGHGVYLSGRLDPNATTAAVDALKDFRGLLDELQVSDYRAVATSAVREAKNGREFCSRVRSETGIRLEPISGSEEARLVHLAVSRRIPLGDRQWMLVDLGGGSVEVSLADQNGIFWSESHTMGSVRLLEVLTEAGTDPGRFHRLLGEYIATLRVPSAADMGPIAGCIATGGNIETLAKLGGDRERDGVSVLARDALQTVIARLARLSYRQRVQDLGLREDRADVVLPAALVYERLAALAGADEILVPHVGIKEGTLYDLVGRLTGNSAHEDRRSREIQTGALALGRRYLFDEAHANHVAEMALSLFDQLGSLHGLSDTERCYLLAASLLHDIGQFVSYKGHHKHSLYLISHSELPSLTAREMSVVANVARYHRKSEPRAHHYAYSQLGDEERRTVSCLGAILRVADSLDREHVQRVRQVLATPAEGEVVLTLEGAGDLILEGWALKRKSQMFRSVFGRKVSWRTMAEEA